MVGRMGVIGGSGLEDLARGTRHELKTRDRRVFQYYTTESSGVDVIFIPRHGDEHQNLPLDVPYLDIFKVLKKEGVEAILAFSATGTLDEKVKLSNKKSFVVPHDSMRGFGFRPISANVEGHPHADVSEPFNEKMRKIILKAGKRLRYQMIDGGIYVMSEGNQFESKVEIATLNAILSISEYLNFPGVGHLTRSGAQVGMTAIKEVILSAEYEIPYALVACPVNLAAGMSHKRLSHKKDTLRIIEKSKPYIRELALSTIERMKDVTF